MSDPLALVLDRLRAADCDPRQTGDGYAARCPSHEDRSPSLSIGTGDDGRVLVHCHTGCTHAAIVAALGIEVGNLFPADGARPAPRPTRATSSVRSWPTLEALVADIARGRPVAKVWHYHDRDGAVVGAVVRIDEADGKMIRPAARMPDGSWVMKAMPTPRPLYSLPAVLSSAGPIWVCEGEKAADALVGIGLEATTSPGGAQAARHADWSVLAGRAVVIVPDHDEPGEGYRADVEQLARAAGATSVLVVRLVDLWPDLPAKGDAHDWIDAHDAIEPDALRDRLVGFAEAIRRVTAGETLVVNQAKGSPDWPMIRWAERAGLYVNVDRKTRWGNPHKLHDQDDDAERDRVCDTYAEHVAGRPDLLADVHQLAGKVLGCWCSPRRCHGHELARLAAAAAADKPVLEAAPAVVAPAVASDEWVPFPVDILPDPIRTYVTECAAGIGIDPSMIALPLLSAAAAAIGNSRRVEAKPGHLEPPVIWSAIVGESGDGKSPAFLAALRFADEAQETRFRDHAAAMADHEADVAAHEGRVASWRRSMGKADTEHPGPPPTPPTAERYVARDITTEALAVLLKQNPRGVLVANDELAGWLGSFDAYRSGRGGADAPRWLSMHTAGPLTVDRKGSGTIHVPSAAVSVCGGIQPGTLTRALGQQHVENGMLARLVLTMPPMLPPVWDTTTASFATVDAMRRLWGTLLAIPLHDDGPKVLDLEPEATDIYRPWWTAIRHEVLATTGPVRWMLSKTTAHAARLALVVHVVRQAHGDTDAGDRIDAVSMSAGIALARWAAGEARRVYRVLLAHDAASTTTQDDEAAVQWIEARGGFATIRDIGHGLTRFKASGAAEAVCRRLVASGRATREVATTGGRPADGIRLVGRSMAAAG